MVSLEEKSKFLGEIESNPKLFALHSFLYRKDVKTPSGSLVEVDDVYYGVLKAIASNSRSDFERYYNKLTRRVVDRDSNSPFIYDDPLIFALTVGVNVFKISSEWIQNVVAIRSAGHITSTLDALLKGNYTSKANLVEIVVPFLFLTNSASGYEQVFNEGYASISNNYKLFQSSNAFLVILTLKAYDLIIESKESNAGDLLRLRAFEQAFVKSTKLFSLLVYNIILISVLLLAMKLLGRNAWIKEYLENFEILIGTLGVGLGNALGVARNGFRNALRKMLGYRTFASKKGAS